MEFKRLIKKIVYWSVFVIIVVFAAFVYFKYAFTYSKGYRSGLLQKFSEKGVIFKTYEGELILSSVQSSANVAIASEKFLFSVADDAVARQMEQIRANTWFYTIMKRKELFHGVAKVFTLLTV